MVKPTIEDARLMVDLFEISLSSQVVQSFSWVRSPQFRPDYQEFLKEFPPGTKGYTQAYITCSFMETVGILHKHSLINERLLFDWLAVSSMWDRLQGFVEGTRKQVNEPRFCEHFQRMALAQKRYYAVSQAIARGRTL